MRLIDADEMLLTITKRYCEDCDKRKGIRNGKRQFIYEIGDAPCRACSVDDMVFEVDNAPTIESEPKHGMWTQVWHGKLLPWDTTCCSVCGAEAFYDEVNGYYKSDYCPHCGAKMDEVTE